jgi:hypothetical protein
MSKAACLLWLLPVAMGSATMLGRNCRQGVKIKSTPSGEFQDIFINIKGQAITSWDDAPSTDCSDACFEFQRQCTKSLDGGVTTFTEQVDLRMCRGYDKAEHKLFSQYQQFLQLDGNCPTTQARKRLDWSSAVWVLQGYVVTRGNQRADKVALG